MPVVKAPYGGGAGNGGYWNSKAETAAMAILALHFQLPAHGVEHPAAYVEPQSRSRHRGCLRVEKPAEIRQQCALILIFNAYTAVRYLRAEIKDAALTFGN